MNFLETREEIWNTLRDRAFRSWIPEDFVKHLIWAKDNGHIKHVEIGSNSKSDWDGEIRVKLTETSNTMFVINHFVTPSRADEVNMMSQNTLRLWWD